MLDQKTAAAPVAQPERLPPLVAPGRRMLLAGLLSLGVLAGLLSIAIGWLIGQLSASLSAGALAAVLGLVGCFFLAKYAERVLAEKLGQHYVAQLRRGLVAHALRSARGPSMGITIARSTNDLSSIRNWIVQGMVPLVAGLPLLIVSGTGLWFLHPLLALSLGATLVLEGILLAGLAGGTFLSARTLRRHRGNLAARIADTVAARTAIAAGGGIEREVQRVQDTSQKVIDASVHRARFAAALRGGALAIPLLGTALLVAAAAQAQLPAAAVATALTLMGICAGTLGEWGRVVEYRQNYKAGRRIIAPLLAEQDRWQASEASPVSTRDAKELMLQPSSVRIQLPESMAGKFPTLRAQPGQRIAVRGNQGDCAALLAAIATGSLAHDADPQAGVWIAEGRSEDLPATGRRKLIGAALESMVPERGSVARALRYRHPGASLRKAVALAETCGLQMAHLPDAEETRLRRGGEPLNSAQQASLLVARALLREPPLLVLDSLLARLPDAAYATVAELLNDYPGVLIFSGELPGISETASWEARA
ncbi:MULTISPECIES: ABC transporter ATP-binding protein [Glutamicibacter]|uniref:ABC transporter transmembrane domain-containing protein n=1 Tax=Glutamicibacter TaxID=1742989 RepID=UPI0011F3F7B1|nr:MULTISPECIES: ABC transporter ATP-binding protein [Glutamicibacter]QEP06211.1 ABC transporter ATP-binding protein [Glutamicibacter sp. ZJUTW]WIV44485.1 ABC transporter ATP-binding protein [Glutamicibacter nicotianae]